MQYDMQNMGPSRNAFELIYDGCVSVLNHLMPLLAAMVPLIFILEFFSPELAADLPDFSGEVTSPFAEVDGAAFIYVIVSQLLFGLLAVVVQIATPLILDAKHRCQSLSLSEVLPQALAKLPHMLLLNAGVMPIGMMGFFLFVIPGFLAFAWLSFAPTILVLEGRGVMESMKASRDMAQEHLLRIMGIFFCIWFLNTVMVIRLSFAGGALSAMVSGSSLLISVGVQCFTLGAWMVGAAIWYEFYRDRKQVIEHSSSGHELYDYTLPEASSLSS